MQRWSLAISSLGLGAVLAAGGAWYVPNAMHAVAAPPPPVNAEPPAKEPTSYRDIVKKVLPAVVSIESRAKTTIKAKQPKHKPRQDDDQPQVPDDLRKFFQLQPDDGDEGPGRRHARFRLRLHRRPQGRRHDELPRRGRRRRGRGRAARRPEIRVARHQERPQNRPGHRPHPGQGRRCPTWSSATATRWRSATACWRSGRRSAWPAR